METISCVCFGLRAAQGSWACNPGLGLYVHLRECKRQLCESIGTCIYLYDRFMYADYADSQINYTYIPLACIAAPGLRDPFLHLGYADPEP